MDYETDKTCGAQKTDSIAPISSLISSVETVDEFYTMGFADINNTFRALVGQLYQSLKYMWVEGKQADIQDAKGPFIITNGGVGGQ